MAQQKQQPQSHEKFYSNPAFCQQSEFYGTLQKQNSSRQSPVGAQSPVRYIRESDQSVILNENGEDCDGEQEFYEEMLIDDHGTIQDRKKVVIIQSPQQNKQQIYHQQQKTIVRQVQNKQYIQVRQPENDYYVQQNPKFVPQNHRYEFIDEYDDDPSVADVTINSQYGLLPLANLSKSQMLPEAPREIRRFRSNNCMVSSPSPQRQQYVQKKQIHSSHLDVFTTPKKIAKTPNFTPEKLMSPERQRMLVRSPRQPQTPKTNPFITPQKTTPKVVPFSASRAKAQQRLYFPPNTGYQKPQNNTAIVAPMCAPSVATIYNDTVYSKADSWSNGSFRKPPLQVSLMLAAIMMFLSGSVSSVLCFYMISFMGRLYYLDFGIVAGVTCTVLGILGCRTRHCYWPPNRNYISGYIVLCVFSLLSCTGLLVLLFYQPRPGTPLADMTSGAVCGLSGLSLIIAIFGVLSSYCCRQPPPDNRVHQWTDGFAV